MGYLNSLGSYIFHISPYNLTSMATLFMGLTFALLLMFAKRISQPANVFLSSALAMIVLKTGGLTTFFLPAPGPLLYFYVRQLTCPDRQFRRKDMLHFCPLLFAFWMPVWLVLISVIIYLYLAHRLIEDFYSRLRTVLMDRPRFAFRRLDRVLLLLGLFCLLSFFSDTFYFVVAFILIGMAAEAMLEPDSDARLAMPITDRSDAREKGRRLKEAVAVNRLYEDAELTLTTLAVKLMIHPHDLSRIINIGLEKNFSDFINEFRVSEIARKMHDPAYNRLTLLGIAYESGFNSKTTFNRVFKEMTGKTPVEYKNCLKKEVPIDKLAPLSRLRPVILRSEGPPNWVPKKLNRNYMFKNYLKIAWRNFLKNRQFTILNLIGLSTGLACALFIYLWISSELHVDKFNLKDNRLFGVMSNISLADGIHTSGYTPGRLAKSLKDEMAEVEDAVAVVPGYSKDIVANGMQQVKATSQFVGHDFFNVFSYPLLKGNKDQVLMNKFAVLLSDELAMKLFHSLNVMGKTIKWAGEKDPYIITGIFKKPSSESTAQFDLLFNYQLYFDRNTVNEANWVNSDPMTYIVLKPGVNATEFSHKIAGFLQTKDKKAPLTLFLQQYSDKYLYGNYENGRPAGGRIAYIRLFSIIAIFILIIACINFMNLSTAKSIRRSKEVGIKKVMGAKRGSLIIQYLGESMLMTFFSLLLAFILVWALLPEFNLITGKELTFNVNAEMIGAVLWITVLTGLGAGSYPAFYLSKFSPVTALKGKINTSMTELLMRKGLVIFQFVLSVVFIVSVLVIYRQMNFIFSKDLGYSRDNVLVFSNDGQLPGKFQSFMTEVKNLPGVANAASFGNDLTGNHGGTGNVKWDGQKPDQKIEFSALAVDYNLTEALGLQMVEGRTFSKSFGADSAKIIFNQAAIQAMGLKDPIGKTVKAWGGKYQIIGVVKDFHFESLYEKIKPCFLRVFPNNGNILVKINAGAEKKTISSLQTLYKQYNPSLPFEYRFMDHDYQALYASEKRAAVLSRYFAGMAIVISCLGLFGLAAFTAQNRQKEISIRKVTGASVSNMVVLLSKDFIKLVIIAAFIAFPLAWWLMHAWLNAFAYRVPLNPGIFVSAFFAIVVIALLTVCYQSIKAAMANPVNSLRSE